MRSKIPVLEVSSQPSTQGRTSRARLHSPHLRLPLSKATAAQTGDALTEFILTMEGPQSNSEASRKERVTVCPLLPLYSSHQNHTHNESLTLQQEFLEKTG